MAKAKLIDTVDPSKVIVTDKEEGAIPFFVIDDKYGVAVNQYSYMLVVRKDAYRTVTSDNGEEYVEQFIKYEPIKWALAFKTIIELYVQMKEKDLYKGIVRTKDFKALIEIQTKILDQINSAFSVNSINQHVLDTCELIQSKEDLIEESKQLKDMQENLKREYDELMSLIKESRKIIIDNKKKK